MKLLLQRQAETPQGMLGSLTVDGAPFSFTLERGTIGAAPIPAGTYAVKMFLSPHFQRLIPELQNVPGRTAIEIHPANLVEDLKGCIGVGYSENAAIEEILNSRKASDDLDALLIAAELKGEPSEITVLDMPLAA